MIKKSSTFISGALAFGIYFTLIGLLLFYFNTRDEKKPMHFVKKSEERIRVSMSSQKQNKETKKEVKKAVKPKPKPQPKKVVKPKPQPKPKEVTKPKPEPKKIVKEKVVEKKVLKEKVVKKVKPPKKTEDVNRTKPKKVNKPKDLFASVTSKKKPEKPKQAVKVSTPKTEPKKAVQEKASATALLFDSLKQQKSSDKGIENAYLALIEEKLKGWPAQSDYAGEKAKVWIKVEPSGYFVFKVISASGNDAFNEGLIAYLDQLQKIGFGPHKANRAYELNVEFVAKE